MTGPRMGYIFQTEVTLRPDEGEAGNSEALTRQLARHLESQPHLVDWALIYGLEGPEDGDTEPGAFPYRGTDTIGVTLLITGIDPEAWLVNHIHLEPGMRSYTMPKNVRAVRIEPDYEENDLVVQRVEYVINPDLEDWEDE